jgi:pyridoxal phosphate enzyme (YggS family)
MGPQNLPERLDQVRDRMEAAAREAGRRVDSITLLAVTKGQPVTAIQAATAAGMQNFGESYLQEALEKIAALQKPGGSNEGSATVAGQAAPGRTSAAMAVTSEAPLVWHYIGRIQSNKTRPIAESFAWVHAVERLKIAERLAEQRPYYAPPLNVCLQVNVAGEASKGGVGFTELPALAKAVAALPRLKLRGLMCLPPEEEDPARQRYWFRKLRAAREALNGQGLALDTLSMGMSGDLEAAILEGATIIRIGTALFGPRPQPPGGPPGV